MADYQDIVRFYEFFYSKKYGNKSYKFIPSPKADKAINNFLSKLDVKYNLITIGDHFLSRYFSFQFKRVEGQIFKRFAGKDVGGKVQIYDIIGNKAYEYFEKRDVKFDYIIEIPVGIVKNHEPIELGNNYEELEKKKFFNTEKGLVNCIEKTTLYNHHSSNCILCVNKNTCKELLKKNYKSIYDNRGYGRSVK